MLRREGTRGLFVDSFVGGGGEAPDSVETSDGGLVGAAKSLDSTEPSGTPAGGVAIFCRDRKRELGYQELG